MANCFADLKGAILTIGTGFLQRQWRVLNDRIVPVSILCYGKEWLNSPQSMPSDDAVDPELDVTETSCGLTARLVPSRNSSRFYSFQVYRDTSAIVQELHSAAPAASHAQTPESSAGTPTGLEIDPVPGTASAVETMTEVWTMRPPHLLLDFYELFDQTDCHDNLLQVRKYRLSPQEHLCLTGNLFVLENPADHTGMIFLKHAPLPHSRPIPSDCDFDWERGKIRFPDDTYSNAFIAYRGGADGMRDAIQTYQLALGVYREGLDGQVLSNTWGDRNRDQALNEPFILRELELAGEIGIDVCQIDDGWQSGTTSNSILAQQRGGVWEGYHKTNPDFWSVNPERFHNGLEPLVAGASRNHVGIGLWFSPDSADDFANWRKDVEVIRDLHDRYGIRWFKIDGVKSRTKTGETHLKQFFAECLKRTSGDLTFDLDVTAEIRPGYFGLCGIGAIFLENRYSDWHAWWPGGTFRNLWLLTRIMAPVRLRMECLNPERNQELYREDPLAPVHYGMDWIFATVMVASPLIWGELRNLSERCRTELQGILRVWKLYRKELHTGTVAPVGECPDGFNWSGYFCRKDGAAHLIVFRDVAESGTCRFILPVSLDGMTAEVLYGSGDFSMEGNTVSVALNQQRSMLWIRFQR